MKKRRGTRKIDKKYQGIVVVLMLLVAGYKYVDEYLNPLPTVDSSANEVRLEKCIDGDTARFSEIGKTRFLLIDTPESTNKIEIYGKQASAYTCNVLSKAKKITYEYDGSKKDRYGRTLAWIFVDGQLLQEMIAKEGYVKKYYIYKKNYKYENRVRASLNDKYHIFVGK